MRYIDGFVIAVPKKNLKTYKKMAALGGKLWMKHGAVAYVEAVGDDLTTAKEWGALPFPDMTKTKKGETVIFSFITFKSRKHRDAVNAKVMKDPLMNDPKMKEKPMPFEMNRMAYGGFTTLVDL